MPEVVAGGPNIPVALMNDLAEERVVFFCGAGVSSGTESNLPTFGALVRDVYEDCGVTPNSVERDACRATEFDRVLDLLEQRLVPGQVRSSVIKRLSVAPCGNLPLHRAVIDLSRTTSGVRLVTTNFDNRFCEAGLNQETIDAAPKLPVPKPHNWSTLVHLHGRIPSDSDGSSKGDSDLVLTSSDFGRAYLTERWAARFVTELFRHFTVVFVGYSISDPVMRYLMDALAAERREGVRLGRAYAFAGAAASSDTVGVEDSWRAKRVKPIVYDDRDRHRLLRETLTAWAQIRTDPHVRSQIVLNGIKKHPGPIGDRDVERVIWALQDSATAQALANALPCTDEQDYSKIEAWLSEFDRAGLLGRVDRDATPRNRPHVQLVDDGRLSQSPIGVDRVTAHLATWISRHLHVPQVFAWVVQRGGKVHPHLRWKIRRRLTERSESVPRRLRLLWTVILQAEHTDPRRLLFHADQHAVSGIDSEKYRLEEEVVRSLAPRLVVHSGPSSSLRFRSLFNRESAELSPLDVCGHLRLSLGDNGARRAIRGLLTDAEVLSRHAERLTRYLDDALVLLPDADNVPTDDRGDPRQLDRSWIAADCDPDYDRWTYLIDLARDSYLALAKSDPDRAAMLLRRWASSQSSLFQRLILHAVTEDQSADLGMVEQLLLRGPEPGLWRRDLLNEILRFLNRAGWRLPDDLCSSIIDAVHAGPISNPGNESDPCDLVQKTKFQLLFELHLSGIELDADSDLLPDGVEPPSDGDFDQRHGVHVSKRAEIADAGASASPELLEMGIDELAEALEDDPAVAAQIYDLVLRAPEKVGRALGGNAERDLWPLQPWTTLLWRLSSVRAEKKPMVRLEDEVARLLLNAPEELFRDVGAAASRFLSGIATDWHAERESEFARLWGKAWLVRQDEGSDDANPVNRALNQVSGILAEAALHRLWKHEPRVDGLLPTPVRSYFDAIVTDSRGHLGRVMLASRLNALFAIDPNWTGEHLVPLLDPARVGEAEDLWAGFAWSPTVGPNLLEAFKGHYLSVLKREGLRDRVSRALVGLLVHISISLPRAFTIDEIRSVVHTLPEESLSVGLRALQSHLTGEPDEREHAWRYKVMPWLNAYWPREGEKNSDTTSEAMIRVMIESGAAFQDAVSWCISYLRPIKGNSLYALGKSGHVQGYPDAVLEVLESVIQQDTLEVYRRSTLAGILDDLLLSKPEIASDLRFQRLRGVATS